MKTRLLILVSFLLTAFVSAREAEKKIELESKDGRMITGVILSVGEKSLRLLRADKKEFDIPFSRLTDESVAAAKNAVVEKPEPSGEKADPPPKTLPPITKDAKHPKKINLKLMSEDARYGYTDKAPILVGSKEEFGGPKAERDFLDTLLDGKGGPISYKRLGSGSAGSSGNPLDMYEITTSDGEKVMLWIDMYHPKSDPEKQPAPVGFYKKR